MPKGKRLHPLTDEQRFWPKVDKRGPGECWPWLASRSPFGYGWFWSPERRTMGLAHRFAFVLAGGVLPPDSNPLGMGPVGVLVRHTCDNPPCVNPAHLVSGTHLDNMRDCHERGREASHVGEKNPNVRLTRAQVDEIRRNYTGRYGEKMDIVRAYGISSGQVSKILLRRSGGWPEGVTDGT